MGNWQSGDIARVDAPGSQLHGLMVRVQAPPDAIGMVCIYTLEGPDADRPYRGPADRLRRLQPAHPAPAGLRQWVRRHQADLLMGAAPAAAAIGWALAMWWEAGR